MSREIKFRAWFSHPDYPEENGMLQVGDDRGTTHPLDCCQYLMQGQAVTLMQYTGLKDKNSTEIYEGDIIRNMGVIQEIVFNTKSAAFEMKNGYHLRQINLCYEVIGNIWENPELLENDHE